MARLPQIGGYDGFLSVWEELLAVQPDAVPARTRKAIGAMRALVDAFPCAFPPARPQTSRPCSEFG